MMAVMMVVLMGFAGLGIDVGHVMYLQRKLQAATDAEALAGASMITTADAPSQVYAVANQYNSVGTGLNANGELAGVTATTPVLECLQTLTNQHQFCVGPVPYNAIQVKQQLVVKTFFAGVVGWKNFTINATATAAAHGGAPRYTNIAVVTDATLSMGQVDTNCSNATQMACALNGFSILLENLVPCPATEGLCKASATPGNVIDSVQRVSLFEFPSVTAGTAYLDSNCTTNVPAPTAANGYWGPQNTIPLNVGNFTMPQNPTYTKTVAPYGDIPTATMFGLPAYNATTYAPGTTGTNPTYQLTPFESDYKVSAAATTLLPTAQISMASSGLSGCGGMLTPNEAGVYGTYYAGALYAAHGALLGEQALNPGSDNVIILLSDGDANAPQTAWSVPVINTTNANGTYPSYLGQCSQGVDAASNFRSDGTKVYTVAYGSPVTGCSTDALAGSHPLITPCQSMAAMATNSHYFYSDFNQSGTYSTCTTSFPTLSLADIFLTIAIDLTTPRLIPENWT